eukprot:2757988-Rhodomonas_salina.1
MGEGRFSANGAVVRSRWGTQWNGRVRCPARPQDMMCPVGALELKGSTAGGRLRGGLWVTCYPAVS